MNWLARFEITAASWLMIPFAGLSGAERQLDSDPQSKWSSQQEADRMIVLPWYRVPSTGPPTLRWVAPRKKNAGNPAQPVPGCLVVGLQSQGRPPPKADIV